jgi:hypothetical protein
MIKRLVYTGFLVVAVSTGATLAMNEAPAPPVPTPLAGAPPPQPSVKPPKPPSVKPPKSVKVEMCHQSGKNHMKDIEVSQKHVNSHKKHGDTEGPCPASPRV